MIPSGFTYKPVINIKGCDIGIFTYNWAYFDKKFFENVRIQMENDLLHAKAAIKIIVMHGGNQNKNDASDF